MGYKVVSAYATLRVRNNLGQEVLTGFYKDAVLPADVNQEDLDRHLRKAMVVEVDEPAPERPADAILDDAIALIRADEAGTADPAPERPAGNASREAWAAYAKARGASDDDTRPVEEGGMSRDDLRTLYGG